MHRNWPRSRIGRVTPFQFQCARIVVWDGRHRSPCSGCSAFYLLWGCWDRGFGGRFDYVSVNTPERQGIERFAILVLSDDRGAVIREAAPPQR